MKHPNNIGSSPYHVAGGLIHYVCMYEINEFLIKTYLCSEFQISLHPGINAN